MTPPLLRRSATIAGLAVAGALVLAGCSSPLPEPSPGAASTVATAVLTADQLDAVSERIGSALATADGALDASQLTGVLSGPALTIRTAQYRIAKATSPESALTVLPSALQSQFVPTTQAWPRTAMAVTTQPENLEAQRLVVLEQPAARENYTLWGWVRLFPGTALPTFVSADVGTEQVTDSTGLSAQVPDVLAAYVDYLNLGKSSKHAGEFEKDELVTSVLERRSAMTKALKAIDGKYSYTFSVPGGPVQALRTLDGGALVVARLTARENAKGPKGSKVSPDDEVKGLVGDAKTSNALVVGHTVLVAFQIPPEGSSDTVTVLGAEDAKTSAKIP